MFKLMTHVTMVRSRLNSTDFNLMKEEYHNMPKHYYLFYVPFHETNFTLKIFKLALKNTYMVDKMLNFILPKRGILNASVQYFMKLTPGLVGCGCNTGFVD